MLNQGQEMTYSTLKLHIFCINTHHRENEFNSFYRNFFFKNRNDNIALVT